MTVGQVIESVMDELGICRIVMHANKSARVEYALQNTQGESVTLPDWSGLFGD